METVLSILVTLFFGWPAILAAAVLAGIGLYKTWYRLLIAAAIVAFGPFWFLSGFPVVGSPIFLTPLLLFGAAFAMYRRHEMIAWLLAIPFYLLVALLVYVVFIQPVSMIQPETILPAYVIVLTLPGKGKSYLVDRLAILILQSSAKPAGITGPIE